MKGKVYLYCELVIKELENIIVMKAKVLFIAIGLFIGLSSFKGGKRAADVVDFNTSISGVVLDEVSGEALVGVEVTLEGSNLTTYTDFDGKFSFNEVVPGDYKVSTDYVSYESTESTGIKLNQDEMHTLNLSLRAAK